MGPQLESSNYRVEVSGWDSSENFFVEKTALTWAQNSEKQVTLKSSLREGSVIFVRLLQTAVMVTNIPVAYQAISVAPKGADGRMRVSMVQLRPRRSEGAAEMEHPSGTKVA
jgi:hypothetical protein